MSEYEEYLQRMLSLVKLLKIKDILFFIIYIYGNSKNGGTNVSKFIFYNGFIVLLKYMNYFIFSSQLATFWTLAKFNFMSCLPSPATRQNLEVIFEVAQFLLDI